MPRGAIFAAAIAFAVTLAYATVLLPAWETYPDDRAEYFALARGLVERGEFTRAPVGAAFVPEPLRTPGYPLILASLCRTIGCGPWQVATSQGALLALTVLMVAWLARRIDARAATPAAWATALYLPFAYHAARPISDLPATFLLVASAAALVIARERGSPAWALAFGTLCALLALTRPLFLFVPAAFAIGGCLVDRRVLLERWRIWVLAGVSFLATLAPVAIQSTIYFGAPSASSSGTGLWWGYFQGRGGAPDAVDAFRMAASEDAAPSAIARLGAAIGLDPLEAAQAAAGQREIDAFNAITDRGAQAYAWVDLNASLRERALALIRHDPLGWAARGITVRSIELWAGDDPFAPPGVAVAATGRGAIIVPTELMIAFIAIVGLVIGARADRREVYVLAALLLYVWIASFPFVTEARYALPTRPFLLIAAVIGVLWLMRRRAPADEGIS